MTVSNKRRFGSIAVTLIVLGFSLLPNLSAYAKGSSAGKSTFSSGSSGKTYSGGSSSTSGSSTKINPNSSTTGGKTNFGSNGSGFKSDTRGLSSSSKTVTPASLKIDTSSKAGQAAVLKANSLNTSAKPVSFSKVESSTKPVNISSAYKPEHLSQVSNTKSAYQAIEAIPPAQRVSSNPIYVQHVNVYNTNRSYLSGYYPNYYLPPIVIGQSLPVGVYQGDQVRVVTEDSYDFGDFLMDLFKFFIIITVAGGSSYCLYNLFKAAQLKKEEKEKLDERNAQRF
jgi:hypothetical protein